MSFVGYAAVPPLGPRSTLAWRVGLMIGGATLIGVGVSLSLRSGLGAAPWEVFHEGVARSFDADIGLVAFLVGLVALAFWFPLRLRPSIGTYVTLGLIAGVVQLLFPRVPQGSALPVQLAMTTCGVLATGLGVACCIRSQLGTGPRDGIALGLAQMGFPLWQVRIAVDVTLVALGFVLGGTAGVGTLVEAVSVGPIVGCALTVFDRVAHRPASAQQVGAREQLLLDDALRVEGPVTEKFPGVDAGRMAIVPGQ